MIEYKTGSITLGDQTFESTEAVIGEGKSDLFPKLVDKSIQYVTAKDLEGIYQIGPYSFYYTALLSIEIPEGIETIPSSAFYGCDKLKTVVLPSTLKLIEGSAFRSCIDLESITFPEGLLSFGIYAFGGCSSLETLVLPSTTMSIAANAFYGCANLQSITILATTPPELSLATAFSGSDCPIYVPAESVDTYKGASKWSDLASRIEAIPS